MAWTVIEAPKDDVASDISSFASGVTSIDDFSMSTSGHNTVTVLIQYTT